MKSETKPQYDLYTFPTPFTGIEYFIRLGNPSRLQMAVEYMLLGCSRGHSHNFAIEAGNNSIYTTKLGTECIARVLEPLDDQ